MQLALGSDPRTDVLRVVQARLIARFGRIVRPADKRRDPVWALVQGVIGARTRTAASNFATDRLLAEYGSWEQVAEVPLPALVERLATQTFPDIAAERLKACLTELVRRQGRADLSHLAHMTTDEALAWLETLPGVARKVAASVTNTSTLNRRTLVIDSHHRRVAQRMGLVPGRADTTRAYDALMPVLPEEWAAADCDEHHLLVKRLGQTFCRPAGPDCGDCPVALICPASAPAHRA
ncbi:MAG: endonuclease III [Candidatus Andeanibacterium colombiense]|uniref:Endonuclease III n=1 Tax=Candidatus Andeanibacterium colombiense TaxID=3121345 RepID=A0AAJ6BLE2_9SPHN|nr:MAG: endonuclease III [Sphingomonadaceae bacterium]